MAMIRRLLALLAATPLVLSGANGANAAAHAPATTADGYCQVQGGDAAGHPFHRQAAG
jgi:hypothetical protein